MRSEGSWVAALHAAKRVFCLSHPKPDGDAVGSLLGIAHVLESVGKEVVLVLPDQIPSYLHFLPGVGQIFIWSEAAEYITKAAQAAEIFFCVDFGKWDRIAPALRELIDPTRLIWVDHHADSEPLSELWNFWSPEAAATCELLYEQVLSPWYGQTLPLPARIALYTGILTDTGGFRFRSVSPHTLRTAAELIQPPFPLEAIHYHIFQKKKLSTLRFQSYLIQYYLRRLEGLPVIILPISERILIEFGASWEDVETLPNQLLALEGTLLVVVLKEYPDHTRLSFRSLGEFPCHELAQHYDIGGGHKNAAGATFHRSLEESVNFTERLLRTAYADTLLYHYHNFCAGLELQKQL
ncbi:MAG: DHH family phosphoesterase [Bacteroidia bacterium]|nr:DHH family phosphoesterase [Bacteroidia bacterium]MDW8133697.1 DHH family phosphoesterase [Bacteroidia bacterium]